MRKFYPVEHRSPDEAGGGPSAPKAAPNPQDSGAAPVPAPQGGTVDQDKPGPVPYDRFKTVNDERQQLRSRLEQLEKRNQELTDFAVKASARLSQPAEPQPSAPASSEPDIEEQAIREKLFGTDANGQEAQKAMDRYFAWRVKRDGLVRAEEVDAKISAAIGRIEGRMVSGSSTSSRFKKWEDSGMITPEEGRKLQGVLQTELNKPNWREARDNPDNVAYLAERLLTRAIESGDIRPFSKPRTSPLAAGGRSRGGVEPPADVDIDPSELPFSSLKGVGKDKAKSLLEVSRKRYKGAMA